jgi:serine/threonine protein kinase
MNDLTGRRQWERMNADAKDFVRKLLQPDPSLRLKPEQALIASLVTLSTLKLTQFYINLIRF